jgi:hypothetical protein
MNKWLGGFIDEVPFDRKNFGGLYGTGRERPTINDVAHVVQMSKTTVLRARKDLGQRMNDASALRMDLLSLVCNWIQSSPSKGFLLSTGLYVATRRACL